MAIPMKRLYSQRSGREHTKHPAKLAERGASSYGDLLVRRFGRGAGERAKAAGPIRGASEDAALRQTALLTAIMELADSYGYGSVDPLLILAQSSYETARFTSRLVVEDKNAFGMMQPHTRPTTSKGAGASGFATYDDLRASVEDYLMRQKYFRIPGTADPVQYINATVASGYATNADYGRVWADVYRQYLVMDSAGDGVYTVPGGPVAPTPEKGGDSSSMMLLGGAALFLLISKR